MTAVVVLQGCMLVTALCIPSVATHHSSGRQLTTTMATRQTRGRLVARAAHQCRRLATIDICTR